MAGDIKGITIEFRGNATPLQKAIRQVDSELKKTTKELSNVNKALKFNPGNVDLWRQKQQLLKEKINETTDKLKALKAAQKQMDDANVDKNSEQYRKLQREIIETESQLKHFKSELRAIGQVNLRALGEQFQQIGSKLESAGRSMRGLSTAAAGVAASIGAITVKSGQWADDLNTMSKIYSISTKDLQKYSAAAELVDVDVETIAKSHVRLEKQMLSASKGTGASAEAFEKLGVEVTNADGSLKDGDQVWQETIQALGKMENETERDALAMQLMGKSATELNPLIEDGGEAYEQLAKTMEKYGLEFIDEETLAQANAFNDSLDTIKAIGMVAFQQLGTTLAAYLAPALEKAIDLVGRFANWITNLDPKILAIVAGIAGVVAALAPVLIVIGKISTGVGALIKVIGLLAGPVGIVIAVIAALVAVGVLLYKNWDTIKAKAIEFKNSVVATFNDFKNRVTTTFNNIKNAIVTPIQNAINTVRSIIQKIKSFFPISVGNIFKNIKLPHFKLSGKLSISPPSVPHISVSWYKQGGIFDSPTVLAGIGEAGPEAVVPLDKFWEKMDAIAAGAGGPTINIYQQPGQSPRELALEVERVLANIQRQREMAYGRI